MFEGIQELFNFVPKYTSWVSFPTNLFDFTFDVRLDLLIELIYQLLWMNLLIELLFLQICIN